VNKRFRLLWKLWPGLPQGGLHQCQCLLGWGGGVIYSVPAFPKPPQCKAGVQACSGTSLKIPAFRAYKALWGPLRVKGAVHIKGVSNSSCSTLWL